jgi:hypothetical protein
MKTAIMVSALALILIGVVFGVSFYYASLPTPSDSDKDSTEAPVYPTVGKLEINNLAAYSNGTVSFDVAFHNDSSRTIEAVIINGVTYLWLEGSSENGTLLNGQTKSWSKNIEGLSVGAEIEVTLEGGPDKASDVTTVSPSPTPSSPDIPNEPDAPELPSYYYDYYSNVGLFERGVYFIGTSQNPLTQLSRSDLPMSYWELIWENVTVLATEQDFISILVSRGDFPTGGYTLQVETFSWLESYPVKFRFHVNFTDPGEGVGVTQAFTNPTVLVPIGRLSPGEYQVEVHIVSYILTYDEHGNPNYHPIMTFKEEVWSKNLTIKNPQEPSQSTTFEVAVNTNQFSNLTVPVIVSSGMTKEKAELISESTFIHVKGEETLYILDYLNFNNTQITASFSWGVDTNDMGHIFELTVDLTTLQITVQHCF